MIYLFLLLSIFYLYNNIHLIFNKLLILMGYKISLFDIEKLPSKLIIIGSHTTIYDFFIGILFYYVYLHKRYSTYVFMKKSFEVICNPIMILFDKKFKLISVDTDKKKEGLTSQICNKLKDEDNYIIFISPEGTRKCTENIRSGYWYIAKNLNIDIMYLGIDYSLKTIVMEEYRKPFESWDEEKEYFIKYCKKYIPLYPERCFWTKDYYSGES